MKRLSLYSLAGIGLFFVLSSCAGNPTNPSSENGVNSVGSMDNKIASRQAYERGIAAGRYAASFAPESPEREKALIEIHGMVSSLRRNGYTCSANDFQKGVDYAFSSTYKAKQ